MSENGTAVEETGIALVDNLKSIGSFLEKARPRMEDVVAKSIDVGRLVRVAQLAISRTPRLLECTRESLLLSIMEAGQLGLEPSGVMGEAYLVPYKNGHLSKTHRRSVYEAQFQVGYRGLIKLMRRSGKIGNVQAVEVYEGDFFDYERGLSPRLIHRPARDPEDRGEMSFVYDVVRFLDGAEPEFEVMHRKDVLAIKARSKAADSGPWITDEAMMWRKTVIKRHSKVLPLNVEDAAAIERDNLADIGQYVPLAQMDPTFRGNVPEPLRIVAPSRTAAVAGRLAASAAAIDVEDESQDPDPTPDPARTAAGHLYQHTLHRLRPDLNESGFERRIWLETILGEGRTDESDFTVAEFKAAIKALESGDGPQPEREPGEDDE